MLTQPERTVGIAPGDESAIDHAGYASRGAGPIPDRRPRSVRRTTCIDIDWPSGQGGALRFRAHARDVLTGADDALAVVAEDWVEAQASETREFAEVRSSRRPSGISELAGCHGGGKLRSALRAAFPDADEQLSGHFLLLDDLAGASLVSSWGWLAWNRDIATFAANAKAKRIGGKGGDLRGVCIGLATGTRALDQDGYPRLELQNSTPVDDLANPADPDGWSSQPAEAGPGTRRARWVDVWHSGNGLHASGGFQDSALAQGGGRIAVHEYRFDLRLDEGSGRIEAIRAMPQVLPHRECPAAVLGLTRLIGRSVADLRSDVPVMFAREAGCTHLNDVLRALVCIPALARHLPKEGTE